LPPLDDRYVAQIRAIRTRVEQLARAEFDAGEYRDADLGRFVERVVPVVLAARRQVSMLTSLYLSRLLTQLLGRPQRPSGPIDTNALRGVDAREVYARPYVTVWTKLSEGAALDVATSTARARVTDLVLADLQLAKTHTAQAVLTDAEGVSGYARTLTGSENCGLCVVASTQQYKRGQLMPIHPGCDCGVRPLAEGETIDDNRLEATHEALEERFGISDRGARAPDYRKVLLVEEHGELGPVLTVKSHRFTSADDLPRT
jgi:hypothetical protein